MTQLQPAPGATVSLLGTDTAFEWEPAGTGFILQVPERFRAEPPCDYACVLKISAVAPLTPYRLTGRCLFSSTSEY